MITGLVGPVTIAWTLEDPELVNCTKGAGLWATEYAGGLTCRYQLRFTVRRKELTVSELALGKTIIGACPGAAGAGIVLGGGAPVQFVGGGGGGGAPVQFAGGGGARKPGGGGGGGVDLNGGFFEFFGL